MRSALAHPMQLGLAMWLALSGCEASRPPMPSEHRAGYRLLALPQFAHLREAAFQVAAGPAVAPAAAYNPADEATCVVWRDPGTQQLMAALLNAAGLPLVAPTAVTAAGEGGEDAIVLYVPDRNFYWVFYSRDAGSGYDLYGQRLGAGGARLGQSVRVAEAAGHQRRPAAVYDAARRRVLVVWDDDRSGDLDVMGRFVALDEAQGLTLSAEVQIGRDVASHDQTAPDVALSTPSGGYVVVWQDDRFGQWDLIGQRLTLDAALKGPNYVLCDRAEAQRAPRLAWNPVRNRFLLVFEDESEGASDAAVRALQLNGRGFPAAEPVTVSDQYGIQRRPRVAYHAGTHRYLVTYDEDTTGTDEVLGRYLDDDAQLLDGLAVTPSPSDSGPAVPVAQLAAGEFVVLYEHRAGPSLWGQRVDGQ